MSSSVGPIESQPQSRPSPWVESTIPRTLSAPTPVGRSTGTTRARNSLGMALWRIERSLSYGAV
jgi:hypothetical protein